MIAHRASKLILQLGGIFLPSLLLCGCGSRIFSTLQNPSSPVAPLASNGASLVYTVKATTPDSVILQFSPQSGDIKPNVAIEASDRSSYTIAARGVAVDSAGKTYVSTDDVTSASGSNTGEIDIYPAQLTNSPVPERRITGTAADPLYLPSWMTVDSIGQLYVVTDFDVLYVYSATANGPSTPTRKIFGSPTSAWTSVAIDSVGNIYVSEISANLNDILVFSHSSFGIASPARTIALPAASPVEGVAVDSAMNVYVSLNSPTTAPGSVVEYGPNASGLAQAIRTLAGSSTGFSHLGSLKLDRAGNLWVVNTDIASGVASVKAFGPTADGNVAPGLQFTSNVWLGAGSQMAVY